jgi:hypothetical protein
VVVQDCLVLTFEEPLTTDYAETASGGWCVDGYDEWRPVLNFKVWQREFRAAHSAATTGTLAIRVQTRDGLTRFIQGLPLPPSAS